MTLGTNEYEFHTQSYLHYVGLINTQTYNRAIAAYIYLYLSINLCTEYLVKKNYFVNGQFHSGASKQECVRRSYQAISWYRSENLCSQIGLNRRQAHTHTTKQIA